MKTSNNSLDKEVKMFEATMLPHTSSLRNTEVKFVENGVKADARRGSNDSGTRRISSKQEIDLNKSIDKTSLKSRGKKLNR